MTYLFSAKSPDRFLSCLISCPKATEDEILWRHHGHSSCSAAVRQGKKLKWGPYRDKFTFFVFLFKNFGGVVNNGSVEL